MLALGTAIASTASADGGVGGGRLCVGSSYQAGRTFHVSTNMSAVVLLTPPEEPGFRTLTLPAAAASARSSSKRRMRKSSSSSCCSSTIGVRPTARFLLVLPLTTAEYEWQRRVTLERSLHHCVGYLRRRHHKHAAYSLPPSSSTAGGRGGGSSGDVVIDYVIESRRLCSVRDLHLDVVFDIRHKHKKLLEEAEHQDECGTSDDSESDMAW